MKRDLRAYVVKNSDFQELIEEFNDFNIEDYKKYNFDDNYIYRVTDGYTGYNTWKPYDLFLFIMNKYEMLTEEEIKTLIEDIDFDESDIYEKLAENNTIAEDIMSVPQLAEKVNHNHVWFNLPISFTIDEDTTLEEYKDYIYDELGLDIEDYLIEERYNCIIEDLKNED